MIFKPDRTVKGYINTFCATGGFQGRKIVVVAQCF